MTPETRRACAEEIYHSCDTRADIADVLPEIESILAQHDGEEAVNWKALAHECFHKLAFAVGNLHAKPLLVWTADGECETKVWEDDVLETLEKFPGAKIDREGIMAKYLSPKERAKFNKKRAEKLPAPPESEVGK